MREKNDQTRTYDYIKVTKIHWKRVTGSDFEENIGILQFCSVCNKEKPCINKKMSVCVYCGWVRKYSSKETDLEVKKIGISKKNSVSGEKIISYSLQIWKM